MLGHRRLPSLILVVLIPYFCAYVHPHSEKQLAPALDRIFSPLANANSPGLAVLVRKDSRTTFERGYGARELRSFAKID